jgi:F5/8 type C domain
MRRIALVLLAVTAMSGCGKQQAPAGHPPAPTVLARPKVDSWATEQPNLLNLGYGVVVVARTGEATLDSAAIYAVDGDRATSWATPPGDVQQSVTIALPARTRLEKVGLSNGALALESSVPGSVELATSLDGKSFQTLTRVRFSGRGDAQLVAVTPTECNFVRASIVDALTGGSAVVYVPSLQARGRETGEARRGDLSGCWVINGMSARFAEKQGAVSGVIASKSTLFVTGGYRGRVLRLTWLRGPEFGQAAVTVDRTGQNMDALAWHEDIIPTFVAPVWFGSRAACSEVPTAPADFMQRYVEAAGWFPLYAIITTAAGEVDPEASAPEIRTLAQFLQRNRARRFRIVAHEFRGASAAENQAMTEKQLASLRLALQRAGVDPSPIQFIASGSERSRQEVTTEIQKAMYSAIEIEPLDSHHLMP